MAADQATRPTVCGRVKKDVKTKHLIPRLASSDIALLQHDALDEIAAHALVEVHPKAVINAAISITKAYPNAGPAILLEAGIPLFDVPHTVFDAVEEGDWVEIIGGAFYCNRVFLSSAHQISIEEVEEALAAARQALPEALDDFLENTIAYVRKEKDFFLHPFPGPNLRTPVAHRPAVVVVRGAHYQQDLRAIAPYIRDHHPVLVGVDGGADALLRMGMRPDIIVGDMDSVSDRALTSGAELVVHAYLDGNAPGLQRIQAMGLEAHVIAAPGTSEDVALLMLYESDCSLLVAVGSHSTMTDFLQKGRKGMASTLLTRMKIGDRLVDAKGVSQLYHGHVSFGPVALVLVAALVPAVLFALLSPTAQNVLRLLYYNVKLLLT
ncbi:MAG: hypothetical protein IMW91_02530 [Firmicutes bacterium]|nr:hypothetical protein [Bacillota bacterium]